MFSGLRDVEVGDDAEVRLGSGFSLMKPNGHLLSARSKYSMTESEFADAASVGRYLVYKHDPPFPARTYEEIKDIFHSGLLALQALKPIRTLGITFYGTHSFGGGFSLQSIERRPPMEPGPWALKKTFDNELLRRVPSTIESILQIKNGPSAERRNAFILLQLGLEHFHPLIAGLLWVMGLEAIFNSANKNDFSKKLCNCLGASTKIFPDWNVQQPRYTVGAVAIHLYTLRNKLAHGVDLRKAAFDPKYPVDLLENHVLPNSSEQVPYAVVLSEAACYLLCQVLQKEIA
jgi:hypothetical protein